MTVPGAMANREMRTSVNERAFHSLTQAKRRGNRGMNEVRIMERGEGDEGRPMSKGVGDLLSHPDGQPRLPDTAGSSQGEQEDVRAPQKRLEGGDLARAPDDKEPGTAAVGSTRPDVGRGESLRLVG
jgi:hypothetical protein